MASLCGQLRELVELHRVIVIDAATGSGKSTLVPICLAEQCAELGRDCRIVVTQPRKLAAKGLAKRVSQQCGTQVGDFIGYRVGGNREDRGCKVVYVTAGHMLEALVHNPEHLQTFSHLVLDEVHERFVEADFLMSLLRLWLSHPRTANTRLVVMSATLQKTLSEFFRPLLLPAPAGASPGKLTLPGSTPFKVSEYSWDDIPREWPNVDLKSIGFGQFTNKNKRLDGRERASALANLCKQLASVAARLLCELRAGGSSVALVFLPGLEQIRDMEIEVEKQVNNRGWAGQPPRVFTMHSALDSEIYEGALNPIEPGEWRIVLATNIAESSLTIPDVSAVIDFGCHRVSVYDDDSRMSRLTMEWCSRASMKQRRGRTGRTCPGQYIKLLTQAVYDGLSDYDESGVERSSLQRVTLEAAHLAQVLSAPPELLAGMPVDVAGVGRGEASYWDPSQDGWHVAFGNELEDHSQGYPEGKLTPCEVDVRQMLCLLPTPPKESRIESALKELYELGALTSSNGPSTLGAACLKLPVDVCLGRLMVLGWSLNVATDAVVLAAALSLVPAVDVFRTPFNTKAELDHTELRTLQFSVEQRRIFDRGSYSEPLVIHSLCMEWLREGHCSLGRPPSPWTAWGKHVQTKVWVQLTEKLVEFSEAMLRVVPATSTACDPLRKLVQRARGGGKPVPQTGTPHWKLSALLTFSLAPLGFVAVGQTPAFYGGGTYSKFSKVVKSQGGNMELALWWPSINKEKAKTVVKAVSGMSTKWAIEDEEAKTCFTGIQTREHFEILSRICGPFNGKETEVGTQGINRVKTRPPRHPCSLHWLMPRRDGQDMTEVRVNWKSQAETLIHVPKRGERNAYSRPKKFLVAAGGEYSGGGPQRQNVMLRGITLLPTDDGGRGALLWLLAAGLPREETGMVAMVAPRYGSRPGDFEVRAVRMWTRTLCLPLGDPLSREDIMAVNAFRRALLELQRRRPHRLAGTWRRVGGCTDCHIECLGAASSEDERPESKADVLFVRTDSAEFTLHCAEGRSCSPPSRWEVRPAAGRGLRGAGDAPAFVEETLDGDLRWSDNTTWMRGGSAGRSRVDDSQVPVLASFGQRTLTDFNSAVHALLTATDPGAAEAGPLSSAAGRRWPGRLVPLRTQARGVGGALKPFDLDSVEQQVAAFQRKLTEDDAQEEDSDAASEAESEEESDDDLPVDVTQSNMDDDFAWQLAEQVDFDPSLGRQLVMAESPFGLAPEAVCMVCETSSKEGAKFSKRQLTNHPDDRKCEACIKEQKEGVYPEARRGASESPAAAGPAVPAVPNACANFGMAPNASTCSKCGVALTKENCSQSQRTKVASRRSCKSCVASGATQK